MKLLFITHGLPSHWKNEFGWTYRMNLLKGLGAQVECVDKPKWKRMLSMYRKFNPDVVICVGPIAVIPILFRKLGIIKKPVVFDWNEEYPEIMPGYPSIGLMQRFCVQYSDYITTPSKSRAFRALMSRPYCPQKIYQWQQTTGTYNDKVMELPPGTKAVYVGEQSDTKRTRELIKVSTILPEITFYLVGEPNPEYQQIAGSNVIFTGKVSHEKTYEYINAADFCVVTQDNDSAIKLYEYWRAKKPVIGVVGPNLNFYTKNIYLLGSMSYLKYFEPEWLQQIAPYELESDEEVMKKYLRFLQTCAA
jgi:hypothetical protein